MKVVEALRDASGCQPDSLHREGATHYISCSLEHLYSIAVLRLDCEGDLLVSEARDRLRHAGYPEMPWGRPDGLLKSTLIEKERHEDIVTDVALYLSR